MRLYKLINSGWFVNGLSYEIIMFCIEFESCGMVSNVELILPGGDKHNYGSDGNYSCQVGHMAQIEIY